MSQNHVDVITFVKDALLLQGEKSMTIDGGDRCLYRLIKDDGTVLKCALGFLIPNSRYKSLMENNDAIDLFYKFPKALESTIKRFKLNNESQEELAEFFNALQQVHDQQDVADWEKHFGELSQSYLNK